VTAHATAAELRAAGPLVSASALAGDLADIGGTVAALEEGGARMVHVDVGDGRYSPLMVGGPSLVAAVRTRAYKDVHLMIEEPLRHIGAFATAGADALTLQLDAGRHLVQCLREIAAHASARHPDRPIMRGIALPIELSPETLRPLLGEAEIVLVLGVVPGYRGAAASDLDDRVRAVRDLIDRERPGTLVSVDGGVTADVAPRLALAGADVVVSGSALFAAGRPAAALVAMQAAIAEAHTPGARQSGGSSSPAPAGITLA
jgi:ribulose-phosphate 3-epimerase